MCATSGAPLTDACGFPAHFNANTTCVCTSFLCTPHNTRCSALNMRVPSTHPHRSDESLSALPIASTRWSPLAQPIQMILLPECIASSINIQMNSRKTGCEYTALCAHLSAPIFVNRMRSPSFRGSVSYVQFDDSLKWNLHPAELTREAAIFPPRACRRRQHQPCIHGHKPQRPSNQTLVIKPIS